MHGSSESSSPASPIPNEQQHAEMVALAEVLLEIFLREPLPDWEPTAGLVNVTANAAQSGGIVTP
jgi:hypothetical protein